MEDRYILRDFEAADMRQLAETWPSPNNPDEFEGHRLFRERTDEPLIRSLSAVRDGMVIAAGAAAESHLHPNHLWTYIEVDPSRRRQGIGTALLLRLEEQVKECGSSLPQLTGLRAKVPAISERGARQDDAAAFFAENRGFAEAHSIKTFRVSPGALPSTAVLGNTGIFVEELATGSVELTQAFWDFYRKTHIWANPAQVSLGWIQQLFLGPDSGAHGALVVRNVRREILAFAISYAAGSPGSTRVVVGYAPLCESATETDEITKALRALIGLLVHRDSIELEVPQAAAKLHDILDSLVRDGNAKAWVVAQDKIVLKTLTFLSG